MQKPYFFFTILVTSVLSASLTHSVTAAEFTTFNKPKSNTCGGCTVRQETPGQPLSLSKITKVEAGKIYHLHLSESAPQSGTWSAEHGTISALGEYHAPPYIPPLGIDQIKYVASEGFESNLPVVIKPNTQIAHCDGVRYIKLAASVNSSSFDVNAHASVVQGSSEFIVTSGTVLDLANQYPNLPLIGPGDDFPDPVQTFNCQEVTGSIIGNDEISTIPSMSEGGEADDVLFSLAPTSAPGSPKACNLELGR